MFSTIIFQIFHTFRINTCDVSKLQERFSHLQFSHLPICKPMGDIFHCDKWVFLIYKLRAKFRECPVELSRSQARISKERSSPFQVWIKMTR